MSSQAKIIKLMREPFKMSEIRLAKPLENKLVEIINKYGYNDEKVRNWKKKGKEQDDQDSDDDDKE